MATSASSRFKSATFRPSMTQEEKKPDTSRSKRLLSDSDVALWHFNLAQRSELTADIYVRRLDMVCEQFNTSPEDLAKPDPSIAYNFLVDMVRRYTTRGLAGSTIKG